MADSQGQPDILPDEIQEKQTTIADKDASLDKVSKLDVKNNVKIAAKIGDGQGQVDILDIQPDVIKMKQTLIPGNDATLDKVSNMTTEDGVKMAAKIGDGQGQLDILEILPAVVKENPTLIAGKEDTLSKVSNPTAEDDEKMVAQMRDGQGQVDISEILPGVVKENPDIIAGKEDTLDKVSNLIAKNDVKMTAQMGDDQRGAEVLPKVRDNPVSIANQQENKIEPINSRETLPTLPITPELNSAIKDNKKAQHSVEMETTQEVGKTLTELSDGTQLLTNTQEIGEASDSSKISTNEKSTVEQDRTAAKEMDIDVMNGIMCGSCSFGTLPKLPTKVVRIFISSTFTDTKEERNAFMENVYPRLSDYCRTKYGLDFQVVDMRWGVPEQASDNHSTTDLCIQEIKKCKEVSFGPNFVAFIGDKYGYRPIPSTISEKLFHILEECVDSSGENNNNWSTVNEWYLKDENCIPPVYVLQPISRKIPDYSNTENDELRKVAQKKWNDINAVLTSSLRHSADNAVNSKRITKAEWEMFFISVTENEINHGLDSSGQDQHECFSIIRKIEGIENHLADVKTPRFLDMTPTREVDEEAQILLKDLKESKIRKTLSSSNLTKIDIEWCISGANVVIEKLKQASKDSGVDDIQIQDKHMKYVDELCDSFLRNIKSMIDAAGQHKTRYDNSLVTEVAQHWHLAKRRCEVFEGREDILLAIEKYLHETETKSPIIIHGCSGCGKTSVMSKVLQCLSTGAIGPTQNRKAIIIPRFLGTTPATSNVYQLLVSVCSQLATAQGIRWEEPDKLQTLLQTFNEMLQNVPSEKSVIILLDSLDQLMPAYGAFKLKWIPDTLPPNVKIVISTIEDGYPVLDAFKSRYGKKLCFKIPSLSNKTGLDIMCKWLSKENKKITAVQMDVIAEVLNKCTLPLYIKIIHDDIYKWKSYEKPSSDQLQTTVQGAIDRLFQSMEEKFGLAIVKHTLSYLTTARYGMSEAELEHVLSLDDVLLNEVFRLWNPPVRRVPPLLWTRIRTEMQSYIVERSADDALVLAWYHRQFIEAVKTKYLKDVTFAMHIGEHLVEYFTGIWGGGKKKPFHYTEPQAKRFLLQCTKSAKDRKVPLQPYMFNNSSDNMTVRYNQRKISELPFHLRKTKNYQDLKRLTFCNFEWLFAKLKCQSILQILEEFEIFMQADKVLKEDQDMKLLLANLSLIRPFIQKYPDSLSYELTGRLAKYIGQSNALSDLIRGCDQSLASQCPFVPLYTCFETADVGFKQNIKFRDSEPWVKGGAITCSTDLKLLYVLDYHDENYPVLLTYDVNTGEQIGSVTLTKPDPDAIDMYCSLKMSLDGEKVYACCRQMAETVSRKNGDRFGIVYVIDIATGVVMKSVEEFLHSRNFVDPIKYIRQDILCVDFCVKLPLVNISNGNRHVYSKQTLLNGDGTLIIVCDKDKTVLRTFEGKQDVAQFDTSEPQIGAFGTKDFSLVILIGSHGRQLHVYDASSKCIQTDKTYFIKAKKVLDVTDSSMRTTLDTLFASHQVENSKREEFTTQHVDVKIAPNRKSFMVIYRGWKWVACLYSLNMSTWSVKYIGNISKEEMPLEQHFPEFSCDSKVIFTRGNTLSILSSTTLNVVQRFQMTSDIRSIYVSECSPKVVVMLKKNVLILNVDLSEDEMDANQAVNADFQSSDTVLFQRDVRNNIIQNEVVLKHVDSQLRLETIEDLVRYVDTDRISTARSKRASALMKFITPNGLRVIHYHAKVQVIETCLDRVEYTPRKGDVLLRVVNTSNNPTAETIQIPGLVPGNGRSVEMTLRNGDRIVNEFNKVKYRINQCEEGQYKIMNVPSVLSIYTVEALKLRRLQTVSVYQEGVLTVSNKLIVTSKVTKLANFINIYEQESGKLTASHELTARACCAQFTTDEAQLFVADAFLNLTAYEGPSFGALEQRVAIQKHQNGQYIANKIHTFDTRRSCVLLKCLSEISGLISYSFVDISVKAMSEIMATKLPFEDISQDGKYAVDSRLNVYDLACGRMKMQLLSGGDTDSLNICARIKSDNKHIVYVNQNDDTLHLVQLTNGGAEEMFCCFCHSEDISLKSGITFVDNDRGILINSKSGSKCMAFNRDSQMQRNRSTISYATEWSRSVSLSKSLFGTECGHQSSRIFHYQQREMMRQQLDKEISKENKPEVSEFNRDNVEKPQVLIVCQSVLSSHLRSEQFSQYLLTDVVPVDSAVDALGKLEKLSKKYDAIVLQLITNDVKGADVETVTGSVGRVIEKSKQITKITLLSLAPCRTDNDELNNKIGDTNHALMKNYSTVDGVHICKNENLNDNGKPVSKFFHGGLILSEIGVKQLLVNFKDILFPLIAHNAPDIQTSGNKQLYLFWSKFL